MKWVDLVPSEFERLVRDEKLCVVPTGSLERHGEHIPFGCDLVIAETLAERASERVPCVVFPGWFLAQAHEAACFTGSVNLPQAIAVDVLGKMLERIAYNGFRKIAILNCHGGNINFLHYFAMSQLDEERGYALYVLDAFSAMSKEEQASFDSLWETGPLGHADEAETSLFMACRPSLVRMDLAGGKATLPRGRLSHLHSSGVYNALWWYADFPENITGSPGAATEAKGRRAMEILVGAAVRALQTIKADEVAPALQEEFLQRVRNKGKL